MDDHKLDKLLHEMKQDYEHVPEYIDKQSVVEHVFRKKRTFRWKNLVPTFAALAGLFLFVIMIMSVLDMDDKQADNQEEPLYEFFLEKKEEFRQSLGMENVDEFYEVKQAEKLIDDYQKGKLDMEAVRNSIYSLMRTPKMMLDIVNKNTHSDSIGLYFSIQDVISDLNVFQLTVQDYLDHLIEKYNHDSYPFDDRIFKAQDDVESFYGPNEIKEFLQMLNNQGYLISWSPDWKLVAKVDYTWLVKNIDDNYNENQAYMEYLELLSYLIDPNHPGIGNDFGIPWQNFDDVLLAVENIYETHRGEEQNVFFLQDLYHYTTIYLNDYLSAGVEVGEQLDEGDIQELENFLTENKESRLWSIVNKAVMEYEQNNWVRTDFEASEELVQLLSGEVFSRTNFKNILQTKLLPINDLLKDIYMNYQKTYDLDLLRSLSAFEVMQLYMHAFDQKDFDTYSTLYAKESELGLQREEDIRNQDTIKYWELSEGIDYIFVDGSFNNNIISFIMVPTDSVDRKGSSGTFQMIKEEGIWKVHGMEFKILEQ